MSSRPNKAAISAALEEWARLTAKVAKIESDRDAQLSPITTRYENQCAPIRNAATEKLNPLIERRAQLAAEINKQLELGIDREKSIVLLPQVSVEAQLSARKTVVAVAEVQVGEGNREIDPQKLFDQVPPAKRDAGFWQCLKVQIGKAEKYLGAAIDTLAKKPKTYNIKISIPEFE